MCWWALNAALLTSVAVERLGPAQARPERACLYPRPPRCDGRPRGGPALGSNVSPKLVVSWGSSLASCLALTSISSAVSSHVQSPFSPIWSAERRCEEVMPDRFRDRLCALENILCTFGDYTISYLEKTTSFSTLSVYGCFIKSRSS